jgi:uncharacterized protein YdaU (DUF1376 family)
MSKSSPYFPFYPTDWLDSHQIFNYTLEQEGAYIRLLAAAWKMGGSIPDNDRWICNLLRCKPAQWKRIKAVLFAEDGAFYLENDQWLNQRLSEELKLFREKSQKNVENANKRWNATEQSVPKKPNKINNTINAVALQSECYTDTDTDTDTDKEKVNQKEITSRINALGVERELWNEFLGTRKKLKANNSIRGVNTLLNRIEKFVTKGQSATAMIEEANAQGWKTVYEEKEEKHAQPTARQLLEDYSWADGLITEQNKQGVRDAPSYLPNFSKERGRD